MVPWAAGVILYVGSLLGFFMWGKSTGGSGQGEEILTNSTIQSEDKKNVSTWINFDFENGNNAILIIFLCAAVAFMVLVGSCLCFFGCHCCRSTRCRRNGNQNSTTDSIVMRSSRQHDINEEKQHHDFIGMRSRQHDTNEPKQDHSDTIGTNQDYETFNEEVDNTTYETVNETTSNISKLDEFVGSIYSMLV